MVKEVLQRLQKNRLAVFPEKCVWKTQEVEFLGYVIGRNGISMSEEKVKAVLGWKPPASLTEVQSFLGFANFYRRFIENYLRIARPMTELTKKEKKEWTWKQEAQEAFEELKRRFTTAPILAHFDPQKPVINETDASDFAIGPVLSQRERTEDYTPWPSSPESSNQRRSTMKSTTRNFWPWWTPSNTGDVTAKELRTRCKCSQTTKTWNISRQRRY